MRIAILAFTLVIAFSPAVFAQTPTGIIFDTDMGNDVDDALALAMLHAFQNRHEVNLLAVTITKDNQWAAPYVDVVNGFYGHSEIPIGAVRNGKTPESTPMIQVPPSGGARTGTSSIPTAFWMAPRRRRRFRSSARFWRSKWMEAW
jgi:hypothetical protein